MPLDAICTALTPVAKRLHYRPLGAHEATRLVTDTLAQALEQHACEVVREARTPGGRLDLLAHRADGRSLAIEIDRGNKTWSITKLARCAEEFWTDALWVRWQGAVTRDIPETVCLIDMTRARVRVRNASAVGHTTLLPRTARTTNDKTSSTRKTKNKIFAIPADAEAMPPKPRTPAISASTKNTMAHPSMRIPPEAE